MAGTMLQVHPGTLGRGARVVIQGLRVRSDW